MPKSYLLGLLGTLWIIVLAAADARAEESTSPYEFEAFVASQAVLGAGDTRLVDDDSYLNVDLIFGYSKHGFHVVGEYFASDEENHLERFQLGYEFLPDTTLWVGEFQQPASAWDEEHHRSRYLQTSVSRPWIENWENEQGIIPQHLAGALLESRRPLGTDAGIQFALGAGATPTVGTAGQRPLNFVGNNSGRHGFGFAGRLAYLPDYGGTNCIGVFYARDHLDAYGADAIAVLQAQTVVLDVFGIYADWSNDIGRATAAVYYVDVSLAPITKAESFFSAYLQLERQLPAKLTAYARLETSSRLQESVYASLFNNQPGDLDVALRRGLVGLRWDYRRHQALNLEASHIVSFERRSVEVRVEWIAAFP